MHIVHLCDEYPPKQPAGIGIYVQTVSRALVKRGHRVTVVQPSTHRTTTDDKGVAVHEFPIVKFPKIGWYVTRRRWRSELRRIHHRHPVDLLESPDWQGPMVGVHGGLPRYVPRVVRVHGSQAFFARAANIKPARVGSLLERRTLQTADYIVSVTEYAFNMTADLFPELRTTPHNSIPSPVDTDLFHPGLNGAEEPGLVMFVGNLVPKKGILELVDAWPLVLRKCPTAKLELVGEDRTERTSGRMWSTLLAERLPEAARGSFRWVGHVDHDQLPSLLARASVCV